MTCNCLNFQQISKILFSFYSLWTAQQVWPKIFDLSIQKKKLYYLKVEKHTQFPLDFHWFQSKTGCLYKRFTIFTDMVPPFWLQILIGEGLTHKGWYFSKRWVNNFRFYVTLGLDVIFTIFKIRAYGNDGNFVIYRSISKFPFEIDNSHPGLKVCRLHVR